MQQNHILLKPRVTEKSLGETKRDVFAFEVSLDATKHQVRVAVEELFKVHVEDVTSMVRHGKTVRVGKRMKPKKRPDKKIMQVRLKKGERIEMFPS